jgi:hypothetical protein
MQGKAVPSRVREDQAGPGRQACRVRQAVQ